MNDLQLDITSNSVSVRSRQCKGDKERLCAMD